MSTQALRALAPLTGIRAPQALHTALQAALQWQQQRLYGTPSTGNQWEWMKSQGHKINPCNSPLHPAVAEGLELDTSATELSVQQAYTPNSLCFGCGPGTTEGLGLRSFRIPGGLEVCRWWCAAVLRLVCDVSFCLARTSYQASISLSDKYQAFPGIINGGILSTIFDCHGRMCSTSAPPAPPTTPSRQLDGCHSINGSFLFAAPATDADV